MSLYIAYLPDPDGSGRLDHLLQYALANIPEAFPPHWDADGDGKLTIGDVTAIQRFCAGYSGCGRTGQPVTPLPLQSLSFEEADVKLGVGEVFPTVLIKDGNADKADYSRASGLVSLAGSARYLISPLLAGILLTVSDIRLLLILDMGTFFLTVTCTGVVRRGLASKVSEHQEAFATLLKEGWQAVTEKRGVLVLILVTSVITCFMGAFQILAQPMILAFSDSATLGICETICASGMLASSLVLGVRGIRKGYVKILSLSLILAGFAMVGFGLRENLVIICVSGFGFFLMLPFANNCLDFLVRTNIAEELQGRAWGLIGFLSQIGYVVAYSLSGLLADGMGSWLHIGVGRGAATVIMASGVLLSVIALGIYPIKAVRELEFTERSTT